VAVRTGARTLTEPIRTWHTGIIIWTWEWSNNKYSWCHYCLCYL